MAALNNAFKSYLDENRFWSYRETVFETIAVLWISTSISAELVKRYFPDWRGSRMDPEAENLGFLWRMLGYDRSSWDRALSFWKLSNNTVGQSKSDSFPVPADADLTIGYMGTYATLTATALLHLLFFYSLFINRSWRHPNRLLTVPAFHQIEKLFTICGHKPQRCELVNAQPEPDVKRCTDQCNEVKEHPKLSCRDLGSSVLVAALCLVLGMPAMITVCALIILWAVVSLLPVVAVATAVARAASVILGEDTVFPCYVLLALGLVVYSAGRMAGMWMRSSYLLWICDITRKSKIINTDSTSKTKASFDTIVEPRSTLAVVNILGYLLALYFFAISIMAKLDFSQFPNLFSVSAGDHATNGTDASSNGTKGLCYWDAIYSYWVKDSNQYDYNILPEPSCLSQAVGSFCGIWTIILFVCFFFLHIILVLLRDILNDNALDNIKQRHHSSPTDKRYPKWYTYLYDRRPKMAKCAQCAQFLAIILSWTIFQTPVFAVAVLPFPVLELFVPEQYHLPGLILILTACAVAVVTTSVHWFRGHRSAYQLYPYYPLGEKLSCGQHPLCGKYRKNGGKRKYETAEEEPILKIAVEELEMKAQRGGPN